MKAIWRYYFFQWLGALNVGLMPCRRAQDLFRSESGLTHQHAFFLNSCWPTWAPDWATAFFSLSWPTFPSTSVRACAARLWGVRERGGEGGTERPSYFVLPDVRFWSFFRIKYFLREIPSLTLIRCMTSLWYFGVKYAVINVIHGGGISSRTQSIVLTIWSFLSQITGCFIVLV